ncbi:MAG: pyridoxal phosphate-dependent aminotransferase [Aeromonadaceae bacterium]|jgi:Bifunctional PLP-dependent enzyme with beta-cystathionase and maltose regulon repressor activities|nr:pyridoxal phosphate-dependent aminotransferase [Aeromonadaceae bacterium]MBP8772300.1 pyridoxal phosphate-dependent aminotransferase [Aeromonadaceae bacterium]
MFDFDGVIDRRGTQSLKWDKYGDKDILPLWVADTDFQAAPAILEALHQRIDHGVFGYSRPSPRLIKLILERMHSLYGWQVEADWLLFMPGVVPGLNFACKAWCRPESSIISPTPVYYPFLNAPGYNERRISHLPMQLVADRWLPDFERLEQLAVDADLLLLCNPHNPGGTVFTRAELERIADIAERHEVTVCSDEIHCDLLLDKGARHIPFASLSAAAAQRSAVLMAPSKTFNIAGLCCSFAIIPNPTLRHKLQQSMRGLMADNNLLGFIAAEAAYAEGEEWLAAQLEYLRDNRDLLMRELGSLPGVKIAHIEATYLAWIDVSGLQLENPIASFEAGGVGLSPGAQFGDGNFIRLNFGCSRELLTEAIRRMKRVILARTND